MLRRQENAEIIQDDRREPGIAQPICKPEGLVEHLRGSLQLSRRQIDLPKLGHDEGELPPIIRLSGQRQRQFQTLQGFPVLAERLIGLRELHERLPLFNDLALPLVGQGRFLPLEHRLFERSSLEGLPSLLHGRLRR